jgi:predicted amidophosphoribosyltransferase
MSEENVDPWRLALVPVPLHVTRRLERGYDPAGLLARELAMLRGARAVPALVRTRATPVQGAPGSPPRRANVAGAFEADPAAVVRLAGRAVWLVDDVVTSGATLDECALALRRAGVRRASGLVLARAGPSSTA